ncbi:hypothetical protein PF005_g23450 [Phytophthora fragariae]|uniref:Uncharacterized protein n=1 Tax=Phytophthora fragariae TaxID=53985 RepID=A0A6A3WYP1_9STRA|nr:hypothetical protein PF009_g24205 [Phytophthora fragariae]KAE9079433.1 hypothetical protein PF007_g23451 [Phytophthora fragariae]KAE9079533.1 hypothetical protein PF010_g22723 [Phytophthora fragariae]KAE9101793.1 hypothetical protein PF006_g22596 [Phytophthora fragariae]KAE9180029.1 hypothetical protein PF005_g23450 [Phytophthora fragariae]
MTPVNVLDLAGSWHSAGQESYFAAVSHTQSTTWVKEVFHSVFREVTAVASAVVNYLNASSSKWLMRANKAMEDTYGKKGVRSLLPLYTTRWNSMQRCFALLLRVRTALTVFAVADRDDAEFPDELTLLGDNEFWAKLEDAEQII